MRDRVAVRLLVRPMSRVGFSLFLLLALVASVYLMLADYLNLQSASRIETPEATRLAALPQPWGGYGLRERVIVDGANWIAAPQETAALIDQSARRYPLDPQQWIERAQISVHAGRFDEVDQFLRNAVATQPLNRSILWSAAQVAVRSGDAELAERNLKQWLRQFPDDTGRAIFVASRWIDDPGELLDRMLPPGPLYLEAAMRSAMRQSNFELAEQVWKRFDPRPGIENSASLQYVELLLRAGDIEQAIEAWADLEPDWTPGTVVNGDFGRDLGEGLGFNWRSGRAPPGVQIGRDPALGDATPGSLRIAFNGKENVALNGPWLRVPVEAGQRYRLSGSWHARDLTTRSLPYLQLGIEGVRFNETQRIPASSFDWSPWSFEFTVPDDARLIRLTVRRASTDAFDRNIGGTLWIDDLRLEAIAPPEIESKLSELLRAPAHG